MAAPVFVPQIGFEKYCAAMDYTYFLLPVADANSGGECGRSDQLTDRIGLGVLTRLVHRDLVDDRRKERRVLVPKIDVAAHGRGRNDAAATAKNVVEERTEQRRRRVALAPRRQVAVLACRALGDE